MGTAEVSDGNCDKMSLVAFIVGAPRSGTYLLGTRLNAMLSLAIPVETHFIPLFRRLLFLWGDLRDYANRRLLLDCIYDFLEIWTVRSERGRNWDSIRHYSLLATQPRMEAILERSCSYGDLVTALYEEYACLHGARLAGDKSAFFNPVSIEELAKVVPGLKVIHIVRDGRDVSLSWHSIWTGPETLAESAWLWREHVRSKHNWGCGHPEQYMELRYEDLLDNPKEIMQRTAHFLNTSIEENRTEGSPLAVVLAQGDTHKKLSQPLDPTNKEKWRKQMSISERKIFEYIAADTLRSNGYPVEGYEYNKLDHLRSNLIVAAAWLRRFVSVRHWRLMLKNVLPLAVWLARLSGFPLVQLLNRSVHKGRETNRQVQ